MVSDREREVHTSPTRPNGRRIPLPQTTPRNTDALVGPSVPNSTPLLASNNHNHSPVHRKRAVELASTRTTSPSVRRRRRSLGSNELLKQHSGRKRLEDIETPDDDRMFRSVVGHKMAPHSLEPDHELKALGESVNEIMLRCELYEQSIDALQKTIEARSQQWQALLEQSRDAEERASTSREHILSATMALQDPTQIAQAEKAKIEIELELSSSKEAMKKSRDKIEMGIEQGNELRRTLAEMETMLIKVNQFYRLVAWVLSRLLVLSISILFGYFMYRRYGNV